MHISHILSSLLFIGSALTATGQQIDELSFRQLAQNLRQAQYDQLRDFDDNGYAFVSKNDLSGIIATDGRVVIPCEYESLYFTSGDTLSAMKNGKKGYINLQGQVIAPFIYDDFGEFDSLGYAPAWKDGKLGAIDRQWNMVIPFKFDTPEFYDYGDEERWSSPMTFIEDLCRVRMGDGYGFINRQGRVVVPCRYDEVYYFSNGMAIVAKNGRYGFVNKQGRQVTPCQYDVAWNFSCGRALVVRNGRYDYIDQQGRTAIRLGYKWDCNDTTFYFSAMPTSFRNGVASVGDPEHGYHLIDIYGHRLSATYSCICDFYNGVALVSKDGKWGSINENGQQVEPCQYEYDIVSRDFLGTRIAFMNDGKIIIKKDGIYGITDHTGRIIRMGDEDYDPYSDESVMSRTDFYPQSPYIDVIRNGKAGVADREMNIVLPCEYDHVYIDGGLFSMRKDGKWGLADSTGTVLLPCRYDFVSVINAPDCDVVVKLNGRFGTFDRQGNQVIAPVYTRFERFGDGNYIAGKKRDGNGYEYVYGVIDRRGDTVIPFVYSSINPLHSGLALVGRKISRDWKYEYGYIDSQGHSTWDVSNGLAE